MVVWKASLAALAGLATFACASTAKRDNSVPSFEKTDVPGAYIVELADDQVPPMAAKCGMKLDLTAA